MKVRPSVKKICDKCKIIRRNGKVLVIAKILNTNKDKVNIGGVLWHVLKV